MINKREAGGDDGFETMMLRYGTPMLRLACALLGKRHAAEDAVQEAMIRLYAKQERYVGRPYERQYVMRAVVNACRDIQRTAWHRRVMPRPAEFLRQGDAGAAAETGLMESIGRLAPALREALLVRYYLGFDAAESAEILGVSPGVARERVRRARAELADVLKESDLDAR